MVRLAQTVEAAFEVESTYGDPPGTALTHLGLLDTFDPRAIEMNITPVPSIGQSTDAHHASGPIAVTLPLKVALQGTGWQQLLGRAIGSTTEYSSTKSPSKLTNTADSLAVLARDTAGDYTLVTGVVPNEVTLEADYTTGGYITLDSQCTAFYTQDDSDANFAGFLQPDGGGGSDYSAVAWPSPPTSDPLLPSDLVVSYSTATTNGVSINRTAGHYVEVGERYMKIFDTSGTLDSGYGSGDHAALVNNGVIDLDHTDTETITELTAVLNAGVTSSATANAGSANPQNLLKGIYKMIGSNVAIPVVNDADETLTAFNNIKTVSLKIANNNLPIPARTLGQDDSTIKWLQHSKMRRGKADVTLDITMTAEDETLYDLYVSKTTLPLVRLDLGTNGSIALTNGTITSFSRPVTAGGETTETVSIKFRGNGDFLNYSAYAISADWSL
tara:strand:+ start:1231 stop:2559 length:1329 start_codon:yes stop_codon:yes gene_type:complete